MHSWEVVLTTSAPDSGIKRERSKRFARLSLLRCTERLPVQRRPRTALARYLALSLVLGAAGVVNSAFAAPRAPTAEATIAPTPSGGKTVRPVPWTPPAGRIQTPIWPGEAPDMENVNLPPESVLVNPTPEALFSATSEAALDVSVPTMTVIPARGKPDGPQDAADGCGANACLACDLATWPAHPAQRDHALRTACEVGL